jgi:hypothetical protein
LLLRDKRGTQYSTGRERREILPTSAFLRREFVGPECPEVGSPKGSMNPPSHEDPWKVRICFVARSSPKHFSTVFSHSAPESENLSTSASTSTSTKIMFVSLTIGSLC